MDSKFLFWLSYDQTFPHFESVFPRSGSCLFVKNKIPVAFQNYRQKHWICELTLVLLSWIYPAFANSVDPDQLASSEANWSGSALFVIMYVNSYQQPGSSKLIGWKLEVGVASYSAWQGLKGMDTLSGENVKMVLSLSLV